MLLPRYPSDSGLRTKLLPKELLTRVLGASVPSPRGCAATLVVYASLHLAAQRAGMHTLTGSLELYDWVDHVAYCQARHSEREWGHYSELARAADIGRVFPDARHGQRVCHTSTLGLPDWLHYAAF